MYVCMSVQLTQEQDRVKQLQVRGVWCMSVCGCECVGVCMSVQLTQEKIGSSNYRSGVYGVVYIYV